MDNLDIDHLNAIKVTATAYGWNDSPPPQATVHINEQPTNDMGFPYTGTPVSASELEQIGGDLGDLEILTDLVEFIPGGGKFLGCGLGLVISVLVQCCKIGKFKKKSKPLEILKASCGKTKRSGMPNILHPSPTG